MVTSKRTRAQPTVKACTLLSFNQDDVRAKLIEWTEGQRSKAMIARANADVANVASADRRAAAGSKALLLLENMRHELARRDSDGAVQYVDSGPFEDPYPTVGKRGRPRASRKLEELRAILRGARVSAREVASLTPELDVAAGVDAQRVHVGVARHRARATRRERAIATAPSTPQSKRQASLERAVTKMRGCRVWLDTDLAMHFGVETKLLLRTSRRKKLPQSAWFQLTEGEWAALRDEAGSSKSKGGRRYAPYVFTEAGKTLLAHVFAERRRR